MNPPTTSAVCSARACRGAGASKPRQCAATQPSKQHTWPVVTAVVQMVGCSCLAFGSADTKVACVLADEPSLCKLYEIGKYILLLVLPSCFGLCGRAEWSYLIFCS